MANCFFLLRTQKPLSFAPGPRLPGRPPVSPAPTVTVVHPKNTRCLVTPCSTHEALPPCPLNPRLADGETEAQRFSHTPRRTQGGRGAGCTPHLTRFHGTGCLGFSSRRNSSCRENSQGFLAFVKNEKPEKTNCHSPTRTAM
jgi:hypothetical protein